VEEKRGLTSKGGRQSSLARGEDILNPNPPDIPTSSRNSDKAV
jgi:hypothetical protein